MKKFILSTLLALLLIPSIAFSWGDSPFGPVPPDNTAYDATVWDGSLLAPTQNSVRDEIEAILSGAVPFVTIDLTGVTDGNIPYMQAGAAGFGDSPLSRVDDTTVKVTGTDPAMIYDVSTATDIDYWAGVVSDNDSVADVSDLYQIGKGTVPGTTPLVTVQGSTGNVGIGTANPTNKLSIDAGTNSLGLVMQGVANDGSYNAIGFQYSSALPDYGRSQIRNYISTGGAAGSLAFWLNNNGTTLSERMRIVGNTGNVGINTTVPQSLLDVQGPTGTGTATAGKLTLATKELTVVAGDELGRINFNAPLESDGTDAILPGASIWAVAEGDFGAASNATSLVLATGASEAAAEKMRINSAGNVGIGNSALKSWVTSHSALQIGGDAGIMSHKTSGASTATFYAHNAYYDSVDNRWEYIGSASNEAAVFGQENGKITFNTAAAGTADNPITWIPAQTITSAGLTQFGTAAGAGQVNITPASAIVGLYINQDNNARGIDIDSEATSEAALRVSGFYAGRFEQDISNGRGLYVTRNIPEAGSSPLLEFVDSHTNNTQPTLFIDHNGTGGATGYGLHVDSENAVGPAVKIESAFTVSTELEKGMEITSNDSTHGGYLTRVFYASSGALTGATDKIELNIPAGWVIKQCQLHVKTAVVDDAGDDTWSSELNDGAQEEVISAGSAAAQNTNVNHFAHADAGYGGTLTDAETDILLTPQGGNFSSGEIEATCLATGFTAWTNE